MGCACSYARCDIHLTEEINFGSFIYARNRPRGTVFFLYKLCTWSCSYPRRLVGTVRASVRGFEKNVLVRNQFEDRFGCWITSRILYRFSIRSRRGFRRGNKLPTNITFSFHKLHNKQHLNQCIFLGGYHFLQFFIFLHSIINVSNSVQPY